MRFFFYTLFVVVLLFASCSKEKIDVDDIYPTDSQGNIVGNIPNDNQWKQQGFSEKEMALFDDLDTANLAATMRPSIAQQYYAFPNPFAYQTSIYATLTQPLNGDIVVKYVVVNKNFNPIVKKVFRLTVGTNISFVVPDDFGSGNYRLYFTYSAVGYEHFFTSWGNIKIQ